MNIPKNYNKKNNLSIHTKTIIMILSKEAFILLHREEETIYITVVFFIANLV